ncbi:unnamed protein product [Sphenostylis stenocarpa]|uniref:DUF7890 domain-containing protein n=1 Tax=Sphenostylis stenocarpa TaxID=92480 RepID=A0AA86S631_9FABA|nr:unnamed protein product [Sphenostylis stenocarpa]
MMHTMFAWVSRKVEQEFKVTEAVYRDELITKKKSAGPSKAVKKRVRFADSEPSISGEDKNEKKMVKGRCSDDESGCKGGIRVKVKMTKEEATRLLSKCKEGGVLEFKDVARELVSLPVDRVRVVSTLQQ